jgi:hypothetical protein
MVGEESLNCSAEFCPYIFPPPPASEKGRVVLLQTRLFFFCKIGPPSRFVQTFQGLSEAGPPLHLKGPSAKINPEIRTLICFSFKLLCLYPRIYTSSMKVFRFWG